MLIAIDATQCDAFVRLPLLFVKPNYDSRWLANFENDSVRLERWSSELGCW